MANKIKEIDCLKNDGSLKIVVNWFFCHYLKTNKVKYIEREFHKENISIGRFFA